MPIHQICRCARSAAAVPGNSGGRPRVGANTKGRVTGQAPQQALSRASRRAQGVEPGEHQGETDRHPPDCRRWSTARAASRLPAPRLRRHGCVHAVPAACSCATCVAAGAFSKVSACMISGATQKLCSRVNNRAASSPLETCGLRNTLDHVGRSSMARERGAVGGYRGRRCVPLRYARTRRNTPGTRRGSTRRWRRPGVGSGWRCCWW